MVWCNYAQPIKCGRSSYVLNQGAKAPFLEIIMAVMVYREGDSHEVKGVKCEAARIEIRSLQSHLDQGWVVDPSTLYKKSQPKIEEVEDADKED